MVRTQSPFDMVPESLTSCEELGLSRTQTATDQSCKLNITTPTSGTISLIAQCPHMYLCYTLLHTHTHVMKVEPAVLVYGGGAICLVYSGLRGRHNKPSGSTVRPN